MTSVKCIQFGPQERRADLNPTLYATAITNLNGTPVETNLPPGRNCGGAARLSPAFRSFTDATSKTGRSGAGCPSTTHGRKAIRLAIEIPRIISDSFRWKTPRTP